MRQIEIPLDDGISISIQYDDSGGINPGKLQATYEQALRKLNPEVAGTALKMRQLREQSNDLASALTSQVDREVRSHLASAFPAGAYRSTLKWEQPAVMLASGESAPGQAPVEPRKKQQATLTRGLTLSILFLALVLLVVAAIAVIVVILGKRFTSTSPYLCVWLKVYGKLPLAETFNQTKGFAEEITRFIV